MEIQSIRTDDPVKDIAQKIADDLQTIDGLFTNLDKNHELADESTFWSSLTTAIEQVGIDYNEAQTAGIIPQSDLDPMYNAFNTNVLNLKTGPGSQCTLSNACDEAEQGQTADLKAILDTLVSQPSELEHIVLDSTTKSQTEFQAYANSH